MAQIRKYQRNLPKDESGIKLEYNDVKFKEQNTILDTYIATNNSKFTGPIVAKYKKKGSSESLLEEDNDDKLIQFSGFFVLGWMFMFFLIANHFIQFYISNKSDGHWFWEKSLIWSYMFEKLPFVAFVDLLMYLSMFICYPIIKKLKTSSSFKWSNKGRNIIIIFELLFCFGWMFIFYQLFKTNWISRIFLFLHSLVLLMKIHTYCFFNGFMSERLLKLQTAEKKIKDDPENNELKKIIIYSKLELENQSNLDNESSFPNNINFKNFFEFTTFPVVIYQTHYPRTNRIRKSYLFEKIAAIFGIIFIMMNVAEVFMIPPAMELIELSNQSNVEYKMLKVLLYLTQLIPSFITMYVIVWYLIWDAILNGVAELTYFADREFYADWWNSVTWDDFSKYWNVPVHKFLLRHVFHALKNLKDEKTGQKKLTTNSSIFITFFISSIFHEMAMFMLFKKLRYYIFCMQMLQIPLTYMHYKLLKNYPVIANISFWFSICVGPSLLCSLYLAF
ncbi:hypothetical protein QEN19_003690 [Hanseniaspora menglaensis]